jgi:lysophospholipase L1-like esterase
MKLSSIIGMRTTAVVVVLVTFELVLRNVYGLGLWTATEQSERYGWRMLPNQEALSRDLTVAERINSYGFRDRQWDPPRQSDSGAWLKDEQVFRVAIVGNSITYGTSVPTEQTYARVLEDQLSAELAASGDPRRALVMNFAVQGYVFEQMARVYEDSISQWRPDLLIVPMHPHDITPMGPSQDDPDYEFRQWILRSGTYDLLQRHVINRWIPRPPAKDRSTQRAWQKLDASLTERPFARANQPYWLAMAERLDALRAQLETDGGRLVMLTLPRWRSIFEPKLLTADTKWAPWCKVRPSTVHVDPMAEFRAPMAALAAEIVEAGIPHNASNDLSTLNWTDAVGVVHPGDDLELADTSLWFLTDNGHYNAAGHRLLGEVLFRELKAADAIR